MNISRHRRGALGLLVIGALLAGCGGISTTNAVPQGTTVPQGWAHQASGSSGDLLYIADENDTVNVTILTYPQLQPYATITNIGPTWGDCSDASGNVWVGTFYPTVYEFAHGGTTPIGHLKLPNTGGSFGCSVDPGTGNLAFINYDDSSGRRSIDIWHQARGEAKVYYTPFQPWACAYDNHGNLFVDDASGYSLALYELPKGKNTFTKITLDRPTHWAGGVFWDGKYVAVNTIDESAPRGKHHVIYRVKVSGSTGTVVDIVGLRNLDQTTWFSVRGSTIVAATKHGSVAEWNYPKGGLHSEKVYGGGAPWGFAVSVPPSDSRIRK